MTERLSNTQPASQVEDPEVIYTHSTLHLSPRISISIPIPIPSVSMLDVVEGLVRYGEVSLYGSNSSMVQ